MLKCFGAGVLIATLGMTADSPSSQEASTQIDCRSFSSPGRLNFDQSFSAPLAGGVSLHISSRQDSYGWFIAVKKEGSEHSDLMWVVSPPFQTAPQRIIAPGYGYSAKEVVWDRHLRYVLNDEDYRQALRLYEMSAASRDTADERERLGKGTLLIHITGFGVRPVTVDGTTQDAFDWIEFNGQGCVPRTP